jgi:hypothetical protein
VKATELPVPAWVTVTEAAFLTKVAVEQVFRWVERGLLEHRALLRGVTEPSAILVLTSDLDEALAAEIGGSLQSV